MAMVTTGKRKKSLEPPPPPTSFWSLPNDVVLNILARISRIYYPKLSLVSKSFPSLLSSHELYITRTLLEKTEKCCYLCLKLPQNNNKPHWFTFSAQQKLIPIPLFPYEHPESPTIVSNGSEIYIIGGYIRKRRSRYVFLLDCRLHKWRRLPDMLFPRGNATASLIKGKIYVFGGCYRSFNKNKNLGEIYDPESESWELLSSTELTPDLRFQDNVKTSDCFVYLRGDKVWCRASGPNDLNWCDLEDNLGWRKVTGLEEFWNSKRIISVANSDGGRRVMVWSVYNTYHYNQSYTSVFFNTQICCAEISFERRSREELFGIVKWHKMISSIDANEYKGFNFGWYSATVTH